MHRHDQLTGLDGMSIDTMAAVLSNGQPPIPFEETEQLANLHAMNLSYRFDLSMATLSRPRIDRFATTATVGMS
jgi:hypothetical protein